MFRTFSVAGVIFAFFCLCHIDAAPLPAQCEIVGIPKTAVRSGLLRVQLHDEDSNERYHPYFIESVNGILATAGDTGTALPVLEADNDSVISFYLDLLERSGCPVYVMDGLQGRVLRVMINAGIPVLTVGRVRNAHRNITRTYADVLYAYRTPDYTQSSKKEPGEYFFTFKTVRGFAIDCRELYAPATQERSEADLLAMSADDQVERLQYQVQAFEERRTESPLKKPPYNVFQYYCIISTPGRSLNDIKKVINAGLADVGFEYKLPEFKKLTASMLE